MQVITKGAASMCIASQQHPSPLIACCTRDKCAFVVAGNASSGQRASSNDTHPASGGRQRLEQPHGPNGTHSSPPGSNSRVVVDIRGANLDHNYTVWIENQPPKGKRQSVDIASGVLSVSNTLQALGGVIFTILTIWKVWEDARYVRALRRLRGGGAAVGAGGDGSVDDADKLQHGSDQWMSPPPALGTTQAASSLGSDKSAGCSWSAVKGLHEVKMLLQEATVLPLLRPDMFCGVRQPPQGVLLFGPPGTGKTLLARAVAAESGATFIPITGSKVLSKWYGESEGNVRRLFEEAHRRAPSVIFIDEVDSLLGKRGADASAEPMRRVTNEFLAYIDGIQSATIAAGSARSSQGPLGGGAATAGAGQPCGGGVLVMAATNAPWDLDEAALSRFSSRVFVPLPDAAARKEMIKGVMKAVPAVMTDDDYESVAHQTDKYSGRDLVQVCR